jgi:hypothetical protein
MAEDSWMQNRNPSPSGFPIHYTKRLRYNLDIELFLIPSENPFTLKYFCLQISCILATSFLFPFRNSVFVKRKIFKENGKNI